MSVIPAKAGIQSADRKRRWMPDQVRHDDKNSPTAEIVNNQAKVMLTLFRDNGVWTFSENGELGAFK